MALRKLGLLLGFAAIVLAVVSSAAASSGNGGPAVIADSQLQALTAVEGGATVLQTTRTIPHWWGSTLDPSNGVMYGYNMVGADPNNCSGSGCSVTIQADVTPLIVNFDGMTYDGTAVLGPTLASPVFAGNDYGSTPAATAAGAFPDYPQLIDGPGGPLSQGDTGVSLQ